MLEDIVKNMPREKKRIAKYLTNLTPDKIFGNTIVSMSKKLQTSPSMITRTLKNLGFYGWKDYNAFVINNLLRTNKNLGYLDFYKKNLHSKIITTIGWNDSWIIADVTAKIFKYKKIIFVMSRKEKHICREYIRLFRSIGIESKFIDFQYDDLSLIDKKAVVFYNRRKENTNNHILNYLKNNVEDCTAVSFSFGDIRKSGSAIDLFLVDDQPSFTDMTLSKIQFRTILQTILDQLFISYYRKYKKS